MSADHQDRRQREDAARELVSRLEASFALEHDSSTPPGDTEIAAYVDGTLDEVSREIFETRLADDPALQAEIDDLRELRATLRGTSRRPAGPATWPTTWMAAAAAAIVIIATALLWLTSARSTPIRLSDRTGTVAMHGDGSLDGFDGVSADLAHGVREALRTGRLATASGLARVRVEEQPLMSGGADRAALRVARPAGTFVRSDRPTFQWSPLAAASGYRVGIYDEDLHLVVESDMLETTEWTPPASLPRGVVLIWQVEATTTTGPVAAPSPPEPQARFEVLSKAEAQALQDRLDGSGGSQFAAAVILAEAGIVDEARAALEALKQRNLDSTLIDDLLASLEPVGR